jgi:pimeloyl-ACP methyl ester carboxylesterase
MGQGSVGNGSSLLFVGMYVNSLTNYDLKKEQVVRPLNLSEQTMNLVFGYMTPKARAFLARSRAGPLDMRRILSALLLISSMWSLQAHSATCETDDFTQFISGESQCLVMRRFGPEDPETIIVWLHGDVSSGGPANYHYSQASMAASEFKADRVLSIALVRPGYPDGNGQTSTVNFFHGGRVDHYTKENLTQVATAIERLRAHFKPRRVIAVGHSGGAASIAVLLGLRPSLIDGAVLVACPCDLVAWRQGRRSWNRSEDPSVWLDKVSNSAKVIALTGESDDNTQPELARAYTEKLSARGVSASFKSIPDATHNSSFRSPEVFQAVKSLLESR